MVFTPTVPAKAALNGELTANTTTPELFWVTVWTMPPNFSYSTIDFYIFLAGPCLDLSPLDTRFFS